MHNDVGVYRVKVFSWKKQYLIKEITENQAFTRLVFVKMSSLYKKQTSSKQNRDQCNLQILVYSVPFFISDSIL